MTYHSCQEGCSDTDFYRSRGNHKNYPYSICLTTSEIYKQICPFIQVMLALSNQIAFIQKLGNSVLIFLYLNFYKFA